MRTNPWLVVLVTAIFGLFASAKRYTNSWAVEINGAPEQAEALARKYEFINYGKVGILDVNEFVLPKEVYQRRGRNVDEAYDELTDLLRQEEIVMSAEQQTLHRIVEKSYTDPTDPYWYKQWYLLNTDSRILEDAANSTRDLNVVPAWIQGYSGSGVIVAVVDTGVYHNHTDLAPNYDQSLDINIMTGQEDAFALSQHGTSVAGVIAMVKDNNKCGVGIAYNSTITGIALGDYITDIQEAKALGHKHDVIDIYSNSWGAPDVGDNVQTLGNCTTKMLEKTTKESRGGKGAIYVFAAGNGGVYYDSCAANGYVNSIYTIGIGSATSKGEIPGYEEPCSGKMAISFIHHKGRKLNVATTDLDNECRQNFDKTSAATPTVSATIALALEANPNLTWRDVQYLIVYTSDHSKLHNTEEQVTVNGAGLAFTHYFGFGAVDAEAYVTRARHWTPVPPQTSFILTPPNDTYLVPSGSIENISVVCVNQIDDCFDKVSVVEHVVVQVSLSFEGDNADYAQRGQIMMNLTSPRETTSTILPLRRKDVIEKTYDNWPFLSVHFWGEYPTGTWTLTVEYQGENGTLVVSNLTLILYGTDTLPASIQSIPEKCDSSCSGGCAGPGPTLCDKCRHFRNVDTLECIEQCPDNYNTTHNYCTPLDGGNICPRSCKMKRDNEDDQECLCEQVSGVSHDTMPSSIYTLVAITMSFLLFYSTA